MDSEPQLYWWDICLPPITPFTYGISVYLYHPFNLWDICLPLWYHPFHLCGISVYLYHPFHLWDICLPLSPLSIVIYLSTSITPFTCEISVYLYHPFHLWDICLSIYQCYRDLSSLINLIRTLVGIGRGIVINLQLSVATVFVFLYIFVLHSILNTLCT